MASKTFKVNLSQGENVIRLYTKTSAWMPNVDCMLLRPADSTDRIVVGIDNISPVMLNESEASVYTVSGIKANAGHGNVYIKGNKKYISE